MNKNESLTSYGIFATVIVTTAGIGIFSYPRVLAELVGTDGWFVILLDGAIGYIMLLTFWKVIKANDFSHFSVIVKSRFGRIIGAFVMLLFAVYYLFGLSIGMRAFAEVVKMYLLDKTPTEFLIIITILIGMYLVRGDLGSLVKFNEIAFWIMFMPMILIVLLALNIADFTNLLPVFRNPPANYLRAVQGSGFSFGGLSIFFLVAPFLKDKKEGKKVIRRSIAFIVFFYVFIVVMTTAVFWKYQTKEFLWPIITMIKSINMPDTFIERWDGVVMALWVLFYFTTFVNSLYFSSFAVKEIFHLGDTKISSFVILPFIYVIAMFPDNIAEVYKLNDNIMPLFSAVIFIVIPFLLLMLSRKKCNSKKGEV